MNEMFEKLGGLTLTEEAYGLLRSHAAHNHRLNLDRASALFIVKLDDWRFFLSTHEAMGTASFARLARGRKELLGIPVRTTIDDEPDLPRIQLVMEFAFRPRSARPSPSHDGGEG